MDCGSLRCSFADSSSERDVKKDEKTVVNTGQWSLKTSFMAKNINRYVVIALNGDISRQVCLLAMLTGAASHPPCMSFLHGGTLGFYRIVNHSAYPPREVHRHEGVLWHAPLRGERETWVIKVDTCQRRWRGTNHVDKKDGWQKSPTDTTERTNGVSKTWTMFMNYTAAHHQSVKESVFM